MNADKLAREVAILQLCNSATAALVRALGEGWGLEMALAAPLPVGREPHTSSIAAAQPAPVKLH